jgi:hypothetical protein
MILYVYLDNYDDSGDDSVLTVSPCYSLFEEMALTRHSITSRHSALKIMSNLFPLWASQPVNCVKNMLHFVLKNYICASFFNYPNLRFYVNFRPLRLSNCYASSATTQSKLAHAPSEFDVILWDKLALSKILILDCGHTCVSHLLDGATSRLADRFSIAAMLRHSGNIIHLLHAIDKLRFPRSSVIT